MRKYRKTIYHLLLPVLILFIASSLHAQNSSADNDVVSFQKRELNSGFVFGMNKELEELLSDETIFSEENTMFNAKYRFENRFWNLLDYKQEYLNTSLEIGAFGSYGDWIDSSGIASVIADQNSYGLRTNLNVDYLYRFYYDARSFTFLDVNAWGRYSVFKQNLDGTSTDSLGVVTTVDESDTRDRFRYGVNAKVGWGIGRLSPMNHLMTAHYLLEKYYPGRIFSDYEIAQFAQFIARTKHKRSHKLARSAQEEMEELVEFVKSSFVLASPEAMSSEWEYGEFEPRFQGNKFEIGPHFSYYNKEPDFLYGGFIQYDNAKYVNVNWNRNFSAGIIYERYTRQDWKTSGDGIANDNSSQDWAKADFNFGWSYYPNLKSQFDIGVRYLPGVEFSSYDDFSSISHNVIPYLGYYTQLNAKSRVKFNLAWRFADGEGFVMPGPEFSLAIYRSRY